MLTEVLQECQAVIEASNGAEALDAMRQGPPDAVVLDMVMPVMDGWTFLRAYRTQPRFAQVPVMVVLAEPTACEDKSAAWGTGVRSETVRPDSLASALDQPMGGMTRFPWRIPEAQ